MSLNALFCIFPKKVNFVRQGIYNRAHSVFNTFFLFVCFLFGLFIKCFHPAEVYFRMDR